MDKVVERWVTTSKPLESRGLWKRFVQERNQVLPQAKPSKSISDKYQDYLKAESYLEPKSQMFVRDEMGFDNGGLVQKDFIELYNKFSGGSDQEFAEFIKEQAGVELKPKTINERRRRANLKIKIKEGQSLRGTAPRLANDEVLTEAKKLGIDTKGKDIKKLRQLISSKRLVEKRRTDPVAKEKRNVAEREYKQKVKERRKVDPEFDLAQKEKIKNYPSRKNMYVDMVPHEKTPKGLLYKDLTEQAVKYQKGALKDSHIQFLNPNETRPTSVSKAQSIKFIDTKVLDKNGKPKIITFDNVTKHIDDNQKLYGIDSKSALAEYDKKITINKSGLRNDFNKIIYGDTYNQATTMGKQRLAPFHVHHTAGRGANAFNVQFAVGSDNMTENGLRSTLNREFKDAKNFGEKRKAVKKYLNNVPKNLEVRLKRTPYGTRETLTQITERISPELRELMSKPADSKKLSNLLSKNFKCSAADGGTCADPRAYIDDINKQRELALKGDKIAQGKFKRVIRGVKAAKSIATGTGLLVLGEIGFAPIIGLPMYGAGEEGSRIWNELTYGAFGKSEKEQQIENMGTLGQQTVDLLEKGEALNQAEADADMFMGPEDSMMYPSILEGHKKRFQEALEPFKNPDETFNQEKFGTGFNLMKAGETQINKFKQQKALERRADPFEESWGAADGGIATLNPRRPHAIPPKSGPMPQGGGLSSMFNRVRKW